MQIIIKATLSAVMLLFLTACGGGDEAVKESNHTVSSQQRGDENPEGVPPEDATELPKVTTEDQSPEESSRPTVDDVEEEEDIASDDNEEDTTPEPIEIPPHTLSALEYLNRLRNQAGLPDFVTQTNLRQAAVNHSEYMRLNDGYEGHTETSGNEGFTGEHPFTRALYAGYPSLFVTENISTGDQDVFESIDGLFAAIYHRFGFLSLQHDEIGIGVSHNADNYYYTYDMGNSKLRALCSDPSSYAGHGYYIYKVCADREKRIDADRYRKAENYIKTAAPSLVVWPPKGGRDIPPVFYEESPDPLPNDSVVGYPVSVQFNTMKFPSPPNVESFSLSDSHGRNVEILELMNHTNDPNGDFGKYDYALFPRKRLAWGRAYSVELVYSTDGAEHTEKWCFQTRALDKSMRFYRIENDKEKSLSVVAGKRYAIYVIPNDTNDILGGVRYSYNTTQQPEFAYIDRNTFSVRLNGPEGSYAKFQFENGQEVTVTISESDSAKAPVDEPCPN